MTSTELEMCVEHLVRYLKEEGAVRIDEDTVGEYRTVYQICDELDIDPYKWRQIKAAANLLGIQQAEELGEDAGFSVVYVQGRGHFLGWPGEEITNEVAKCQVARGWVKALKVSEERIAKASPKQRFWMERRYKDFKLEQEAESTYA